MERGKLVVFEGSEGSGKSTQLRMLASLLSSAGIPVVPLREPGGTVVGDAIREILLNPQSDIKPAAEALLFMASRAELVQREIEPAHPDHRERRRQEPVRLVPRRGLDLFFSLGEDRLRFVAEHLGELQ